MLVQDSQFVVNEVSPVMTVDAVVSSHPVVVPLSSPDEIMEAFDIISYNKVRSTITDHSFTAHVIVLPSLTICPPLTSSFYQLIHTVFQTDRQTRLPSAKIEIKI